MSEDIKRNDDLEQDNNITDDEPKMDAFNEAFDNLGIEVDNSANESSANETNEAELEPDQATEEDVVEDDVENTDDEEAIPDAWVEAGRAAGLGDDEIVSLAENTPKVLEALAVRPHEEPEVKDVDEPEDEPEAEPEGLPHVEFEIPEGVDEGTKKLFEQMANTQNTLVDKLNEANSKLTDFEDVANRQEQAAIAARDKQIDDFLDSQVELCPALGRNDDLTDKQLETRLEIFGLSERVHGNTMEERLEKAVKAYNGIHGQSEKTLAKKLYKNKQRFNARPQGRKTNQQFKNADEKAYHTLSEKMNELGL